MCEIVEEHLHALSSSYRAIIECSTSQYKPRKNISSRFFRITRGSLRNVSLVPYGQ